MGGVKKNKQLEPKRQQKDLQETFPAGRTAKIMEKGSSSGFGLAYHQDRICHHGDLSGACQEFKKDRINSHLIPWWRLRARDGLDSDPTIYWIYSDSQSKRTHLG